MKTKLLYFLPKNMPACGKDTAMKSYDFMMRPNFFDNILETFVHQDCPIKNHFAKIQTKSIFLFFENLNVKQNKTLYRG